MEKIIQFLKQYGLLVGVGVVGILILIYGVYREISAEKPVVEILKSGQQSSDHSPTIAQGSELGTVTVDIAGAVEEPGLYKLPPGSRIGDALVVVGGLAANADREWVAKSINMAEVLKDGGKVYIPRIRATDRVTPSQLSIGEGVTQGIKTNINTASMNELDGLSGIGEVRAKAIFDNRPYTQIEELVSKAKIPESVYEKIKDSVTLY